jgi:hypothetical protein
MNMKKIGVMLAIAAVSVVLSVPAFAQGPERIIGNVLPGGVIGPAGWDNNRNVDVLVGGIIGGILGQIILSNRYDDRDRPCYDQYRDRDRDWDRDRDRDRYYDRRKDNKWNSRNDRYYRGYDDRNRPNHRPYGW